MSAAKDCYPDLSYNKNFGVSMSSRLKEIFHQIDDLTKKEMLEIFYYLEQRIREKYNLEESQAIDAIPENLLQYIAETKNKKRQRSLQDFRGIAPNLLEGKDAQEWVSQMRGEWEERERVWRKPE
ncbi:hypothetical protein [Coleofasciculus sp.]|uniref:hypothetical protein n=1 Tax=Coleofasciculus sp. TaxID=3100458 RepID=UPI003A2CBCB8